MFRNEPIVLDDYNSALFWASTHFTDKEYFPTYLSINIVHISEGVFSFEPNPDYPYKTSEEEEIAYENHKKKREEFVIEFLKKNYPNKGFVERYIKENKKVKVIDTQSKLY